MGVSGQPCIVVSSGRCGSTLLSRMIADHPELLSISEIWAGLHPGAFPAGVVDAAEFWEALDRPRGRWTCLVRHAVEPPEVVYDFGGRDRFTRETGVPPLCLMTLPAMTDEVGELYDAIRAEVGSFPPGPAGEHYRRLFAWLCERFERRSWVERSGASLNSLPEIVKAFPTAKFVHLYRNGVETARSMSRHTGFKLAVVSRRMESWLGVDPYEDDDRARLDRVPPMWRRVLPESFDAQAFLDLDVPFEDFVGFWALMEGRGLDLLARLPGEQVIHMRYEDLLDHPRRDVARFAEFLGIDTDREPGAAWFDRATAMVKRPPPSEPVPGEDARRAVFACRAGERRLAAAGLPV